MEYPVRKAKPNYFYAILSVTAVLFLVGSFGLLLIQSQAIIRYLKENVKLIVELDSDYSSDQLDSLMISLKSNDWIKEESIEFIDKKEGYQQLADELKLDTSNNNLPNPLFDIIEFSLHAEALNQRNLSDLQANLKQESGVRDVFFQQSLLSQIENNLKRLRQFLLGLGIIFLLLAISLIHNTLKLALFANRFLIKNMELVGASWEFISRPYLLKSGLHGAFSGILANIFLGLGLLLIYRIFPELQVFFDPKHIVFLGLSLILIGILVYGISTYFVVNKYLKMRIDDLY